MKQNERNYFRDLYEIAIAVNSAGSTEAVMRSLVENATKAMDAKGCSIMLLDPERKVLVHSISCGLSDVFIKAGPRLVQRSLPETVTGKGEVAIIHDINQESGRIQFADIARKEGIVSILAVPMKVKDRIIGQLRIYTGERRDFTDDDIFFAQAVANLGALALDNARLYEATQKAYKDLATDVMTFRFL